MTDINDENIKSNDEEEQVEVENEGSNEQQIRRNCKC